MKVEGENIIFSDGMKVQANEGIIGLDSDGIVYGGYNDILFDQQERFSLDHKLSLSQRIELADYMIDRWKKFKFPWTTKDEGAK